MAPQASTAQPISAAEWNRTLLHRQHLLDRVDEDAVDVLDRCVGVQSQDPKAAFYALWSRIRDFDPAELDGLLTSREVVRMALLRSTVFLVDTEDARWMRPVAQTAMLAEAKVHARRLVSADPEQVVRDAARLLADESMTGAHLGKALAGIHVGENPSTLTALARCALALVQVPPRGLWRGSAAPTYASFANWAGPGAPAMVGDDALAELVRLYLRGFGPASVKAIQTWAGVTRLAPIVRAMVEDWELVEYRGPDGTALVDLDGIDIVDGGRHAPVRLLAPYDHVIVSNADRRRVCDPESFARLVTPNGRSPGYLLADGRLRGTWTLDAERRVTVDVFGELTAAQRDELEAEQAALQAFCER